MKLNELLFVEFFEDKRLYSYAASYHSTENQTFDFKLYSYEYV